MKNHSKLVYKPTLIIRNTMTLPIQHLSRRILYRSPLFFGLFHWRPIERHLATCLAFLIVNYSYKSMVSIPPSLLFSSAFRGWFRLIIIFFEWSEWAYVLRQKGGDYPWIYWIWSSRVVWWLVNLMVWIIVFLKSFCFYMRAFWKYESRPLMEIYCIIILNFIKFCKQ